MHKVGAPQEVMPAFRDVLPRTTGDPLGLCLLSRSDQTREVTLSSRPGSVGNVVSSVYNALRAQFKAQWQTLVFGSLTVALTRKGQG